MKYILIALIRLYRVTLSRILPTSCRFIPSCSQYAIIAIRRFGAVRGGFLSFKRICRCNPFHGGYDPVPLKFTILRPKGEAEENQRYWENSTSTTDSENSDEQLKKKPRKGVKAKSTVGKRKKKKKSKKKH